MCDIESNRRADGTFFMGTDEGGGGGYNIETNMRFCTRYEFHIKPYCIFLQPNIQLAVRNVTTLSSISAVIRLLYIGHRNSTVAAEITS